MRPPTIVAACAAALNDLFPHLHRPERTLLATLIPAVVRRGVCTLARLGAAIPGPAADPSKARRVQRLLVNDRLEVARAQRRLIQRLVQGHRGRLDLALDATTIGVTRRHRGVVTLMLAIAWHRRAIPLVWRCLPAAGEGAADWMAVIRAMVEAVAALLPEDVQVVVMTDRGLSGAQLGGILRAKHWHFLQRVTAPLHLRLGDGTVVTAGSVVPRPGNACLLSAVRGWAPDGWVWQAGRSQRVRYWSQAPVLNVVARWRVGDAEPWLLVTDLPASFARCAEYRRRSWEEGLFRDLKSYGWNWQTCRVREPKRVERLLLVLVLATVWMLALGQRVVRKGWRRLLEPASRRVLSLFQLGRRFFERCETNQQPALVTFTFLPRARAPAKTVMN
jgi:hypothetical protein